MGREEGEKYHSEGIENIFSKIIEENFPTKSKRCPSRHKRPKVQQADKNRHIIVKALKIEDKETVLKDSREKSQVTFKGRSISI